MTPTNPSPTALSPTPPQPALVAPSTPIPTIVIIRPNEDHLAHFKDLYFIPSLTDPLAIAEEGETVQTLNRSLLVQHHAILLLGHRYVTPKAKLGLGALSERKLYKHLWMEIERSKEAFSTLSDAIHSLTPASEATSPGCLKALETLNEIGNVIESVVHLAEDGTMSARECKKAAQKVVGGMGKLGVEGWDGSVPESDLVLRELVWRWQGVRLQFEE
jgi:hypothetical protein